MPAMKLVTVPTQISASSSPQKHHPQLLKVRWLIGGVLKVCYRDVENQKEITGHWIYFNQKSSVNKIKQMWWLYLLSMVYLG